MKLKRHRWRVEIAHVKTRDVTCSAAATKWPQTFPAASAIKSTLTRLPSPPPPSIHVQHHASFAYYITTIFKHWQVANVTVFHYYGLEEALPFFPYVYQVCTELPSPLLATQQSWAVRECQNLTKITINRSTHTAKIKSFYQFLAYPAERGLVQNAGRRRTVIRAF